MQHSREYTVYMKSSEWERMKKRRLEIDDGKCVMCGRPFDKCKRQKLQCHHITYSRLGHEDPMTDLVTLCGSCHRKLHNYLKRKRSQ